MDQDLKISSNSFFGRNRLKNNKIVTVEAAPSNLEDDTPKVDEESKQIKVSTAQKSQPQQVPLEAIFDSAHSMFLEDIES